MSSFKKEFAASARQPLPPIKRFDRPQKIADLAIGHVVLAFENEELGWWEAMILEKNDGRYTLAWECDPNLPSFERTQNQIALICPAAESVAA